MTSTDSLISSMRNQMAELSNVSFSPRDHCTSYTKKLGVVIPFGFKDRLAVCSKTIDQMILESCQSNSYVKIESVVIPNFCRDGKAIAPLKNILERHTKDGAIQQFKIIDVMPHSAAFSFNRGAETIAELSGGRDRLPDFTIKIDDDSRLAPGTISDLIQQASKNRKHLVAPVTVRPPLSDFSQDSVFQNIVRQYESDLDGTLKDAPAFNHIPGKFDLSKLMLGYHTIFCSSDVPATPNENGITFSASLLEDLLATGTVFPEMNGGSEGLRLFLLLSQTPYADTIGVVKRGIYDRPIEGAQLSAWGKSDAILGKIINELGLMPDGIIASGFNDQGEIYSIFVPHQKKATVKCVERLRALVESLELNTQLFIASDQVPDNIKPELPAIYKDCKETLDIIDSADKSSIEVWGRSNPADSNFVPPTTIEHQINMLKYIGAVHLTSKEHGFPTMVYPV